MHFQLLVQLTHQSQLSLVVLALVSTLVYLYLSISISLSLSLQVAFKVLERFSFYFSSLVTVAVKLI